MRRRHIFYEYVCKNTFLTSIAVKIYPRPSCTTYTKSKIIHQHQKQILFSNSYLRRLSGSPAANFASGSAGSIAGGLPQRAFPPGPPGGSCGGLDLQTAGEAPHMGCYLARTCTHPCLRLQSKHPYACTLFHY